MAGVDDIAFSPDNTIIATERGEIFFCGILLQVSRNKSLLGILTVSIVLSSVQMVIYLPVEVVTTTVRVWDVTTGQIQKILTERRRNTLRVAFSPDGSILAGDVGGEIFCGM